MLNRFLALLVAGFAHAMLVVLVWFLFPFLMGGNEPSPALAPTSTAGAVLPWWGIDALLALQFGLWHSLLLRPGVRNRLETILPAPLYGCFFTIVTCFSLLLVIACWQVSLPVLFRLTGWAALVVHGFYVLSWVSLMYSLGLTGYGYQTGWTPFWSWFRQGKVAPRTFQVKGIYHWLRHPVYLSFLGQIWLTPLITADRLLLNGVFTVYILLGSYFKDRRMEYFLGDRYRQYQALVPGYPLVPGPLGRIPPARVEAMS